MGTEGEGMSELERLEELLKQAKFELPIGEIIAHAEHADINLESEIITQVAYEPSHKYSWMPADAKQLAGPRLTSSGTTGLTVGWDRSLETRRRYWRNTALSGQPATT